MILGSHNSLTYLPPQKKWWDRFYKCQDKDLREQLKTGVKMIDIKVRFDWDSWVVITNKKWMSKIKYEPKRFVEWILTVIRGHRFIENDDTPIYIKLTLDTNDVYIGQELDFIMLGNIFKEQIGDDKDKIILIGGCRSFDNQQVIVTIPNPFVAYPVNEFSKQCRWYEKYFPKLFAKRNNERNMKLWKDEDCIVAFDFI